jgi:hypothetical protein
VGREMLAVRGLRKCARLKLAVSGFVDAQTFGRVIDPAKMVKPYASWQPERRKVYTPHRPRQRRGASS